MWAIDRRKALAMTLVSALGSRIGGAAAGQPRFADVAEFRELVIAAFRKAPGVKSVVADPGDPAKLAISMNDGRTLVSDLSNAFGYLRAYPEEDVDQTIERLVRATAGEQNKVSEGNVVVVIRTQRYTDFVAKTLKTEMMVEPFVADLMVLYMADLPDAMTPLKRQEVSELQNTAKPDVARLHRIALNNVRQLLPKVVRQDMSTGALFGVKGNEMLSPSLILLDEFWESIKTKFPGDVLIALPRKDQLFIFDAQNPDGERAARAMIRVTIEDNFNLLSDKLLARRGGRIVLVPD